VYALSTVRLNTYGPGEGTHSEKPEAVAEALEDLAAGPRIELFARRYRLGWSTWGNELPVTPLEKT